MGLDGMEGSQGTGVGIQGDACGYEYLCIVKVNSKDVRTKTFPGRKTIAR